MIPHGATLASLSTALTLRPPVCSPGAAGPGKGIEWAIDHDGPETAARPGYVVAGRTHPKSSHRKASLPGDAGGSDWAKGVARRELRRRLPGLALADRLVQDAHCRRPAYDSQDQVTSGVLVDALAAGRPSWRRRSPSRGTAVERGRDRRPPPRCHRLGARLRHVLTEPGLGAAMARERLVSLRLRVSAVARSTPLWPSSSSPMAQAQPRRRAALSLTSTSQYGAARSGWRRDRRRAGTSDGVPGPAPALPDPGGSPPCCPSRARRCPEETRAPPRSPNASWPWTTPSHGHARRPKAALRPSPPGDRSHMEKPLHEPPTGLGKRRWPHRQGIAHRRLFHP